MYTCFSIRHGVRLCDSQLESFRKSFAGAHVAECDACDISLMRCELVVCVCVCNN